MAEGGVAGDWGGGFFEGRSGCGLGGVVDEVFWGEFVGGEVLDAGVVEVDVEDDGFLAVAVFGLDEAFFVEVFDELLDVLPGRFLDVVVLGLLGRVDREHGGDEAGD